MVRRALLSEAGTALSAAGSWLARSRRRPTGGTRCGSVPWSVASCPVNLAVHDGRQRFDGDRRSEAESARKANGGKLRAYRGGQAETGHRWRLRSGTARVALLGGIGRRHAIQRYKTQKATRLRAAWSWPSAADSPLRCRAAASTVPPAWIRLVSPALATRRGCGGGRRYLR